MWDTVFLYFKSLGRWFWQFLDHTVAYPSYFLLPTAYIYDHMWFSITARLQVPISLQNAMGLCWALCLSSQAAIRGNFWVMWARGHKVLKTHWGPCLVSRVGSVALVCQYLSANILKSFQLLNADLDKCFSNPNETMWYWMQPWK